MLSARQHLVRVPFCVRVRMICAWGQLDVPTKCQPSAAGNSPYSPATVLNCHRQGLHSRCPATIPVSHCHGKGPWRLRTSQNSNVTAACEGPAWSLYNEPQLYDQIFSFRDIPVEVAFLFDAVREHGGCAPWPKGGGEGPALQSFLEIGCGPARHSLEAAKQGACHAVGIDRNAHMIRYAESLAGEAEAAGGQRPSLHCMDATQLGSQAGLQEAFDLALLPLGTLSHAMTNCDAVDWLRAARSCLKEGGLLCIELAHPGDVFDGTLMEGDEWEIVTSDGGEVLHMQYGSEVDDFDPVTQRLYRQIVVSRKVDGQGGLELVGEEVVEQRVFTLAETELLGRLAGFGKMHSYGDYNMNVSLTDEDAYRLVLLMQRPCKSV